MRILAAAIAIFSALMVGVAPGQAEIYPSRMIKMIVPFRSAAAPTCWCGC